MPKSTRSQERRRRGLSFAIPIVLFVVLFASPAIASLQVDNFMEGGVGLTSDSILLYDYSSGTNVNLNTAADWNAGTHNQTGVSVGGQLELERFGDVPPSALAWWDANWRSRQCVTINNPGAPDTNVAEDVSLDTDYLISQGWMAADGSDLRAIDSATGLPLPLWIEGALPSTTTKVWVQLASVPNGASEFCFYVGNPAATTVSDELSVFLGTVPQSVYYTLTDFHTGTGLAGQVSVVSYSDNNIVTDGTTTVTMSRGQVYVFSGLNQNGIIRSTKAIAASGLGNATDTLAPLEWANNEFIFSSYRNTQEFWVRSPLGSTTIEVVHNNVVTDTFAITPADGAVAVVESVSFGQSAVVRSVDGTRFLAAHTTTNARDSYIGIGWFGDTIYGHDTTRSYIGSSVAGATFDALSSTGDTNVGVTLGPNTTLRYLSGLARPNAKGWALTSNLPLAAIQQADSNGIESTSFYPTRYLDSEYFTPERIRYASFVCPIPGTVVTMTLPSTATSTYTCTTTGGPGSPGQANTALGDYPAGTRFSAANDFHIMVEDFAYYDETNLISYQALTPVGTNLITSSVGSVEGRYRPSGVWTTVIDTGASGVYGLIDSLSTLPAGTTASIRLATGSTAVAASAMTAVGPDGTIATAYDSLDRMIAYANDFGQFIKVEVTLATTDTNVSPRISSIAFNHNLALFTVDSDATAHTTRSGSPVLTTQYLARVYYSQGTLPLSTTIRYRTGSGLASSNRLTIKTDHPANHVDVVAGALTQGQSAIPFALASGSPFSVLFDEDSVSGSTIVLQFQITGVEGGGLVIANDMALTVVTP